MGIVVPGEDGQFLRNRWDEETTKMESSGHSDDGDEGLSTDEFADPDNFSDWEFGDNSTWIIEPTQEDNAPLRPRLNWEFQDRVQEVLSAEP